MYKNSLGLKLSLRLSAAVLMAVGSLLVFGLFRPTNGQAAAGINQQLNFQGRLLDNTGAVVPDGSYNMEFKIYQDGGGCVAGGTSPCGGTLKWTEDWIQTNRATVKNGYFSVNLGSLTAFGTNIDWNQDTLWLSTNIGGVANTPTPSWDGEMTPFKRMAASPYALNSNALQGLQAANFVQLAQGVQADTSTADPSIFINKNNSTGTPNILQLQKAGSDVLVVDNGGGVAITPADPAAAISLGSTAETGTITLGQYSGASASIIKIGANASASTTQQINIGTSTLGISTVAIGSSSSSSATNISGGSGGINLTPSGVSNSGLTIVPNNNSTAALQIQSSAGADTLLTADTTNNKVVVGNATGVNNNTTQFIVDSATSDPGSSYNGAIYYNTTNNRFRCYQNGGWIDCINGIGATSNSSASFISGHANVPANQTNLTIEKMVFTSATGVSNTAGAPISLAPANGSFRSCLIKNNAAITAGTLDLRWTINGVEVGSPVCQMNSTTNRNTASAIDSGVVPFNAGDDIGIAFDTSAAFAPTTTDFTVYWSVEYYSSSGNGITMQYAYGNGNAITTTDGRDFLVAAADTATDANLLFNLQCTTACGSNGRFAVQNAGTDVFTVSPSSGNITLAPAGAGSTVVNADGDSNFQVNYASANDATLDIAHINILDNANASTGSLYGLAVVNNDNGANTGVPDALAYLKNANAAETLPDGLLVEQTGTGTLTSGLEVKQTAGTITNGLSFTGIFTKLINSTNFNVTGAGAGTFASDLTVNGTTFWLGNGSASTINTPSGNAGLSIIPNGSGVLNLATSNTGNVAVGNSTGTFSLISNGGLNVTTGGDLTGVASLDTINTSATALTFANAGTVASSGANGLTLQAGNGTVSLGSSTVLTNTGATLSLSSNGGSDVALNSNVVLRPGTDSSSGVVIQNSSGLTNLATFGTNTSTPNLIANPSLENNANGWTKKGNVGVASNSSDDFAQYGGRSLKLVTTANSGDGASYAVPLKASTQYTVSAWVRLATGTATTLNLNRQDNGSDVDTCTSGNGIGMPANTTFTQFTCTFTTGPTVNSTTNIYVKQTDGTIRTIYVDGVTLVAAASGLTFDAGGTNFNVQSLNSSVTLNSINSGDVQPWQLSSTPLTTPLRYGSSVNANGYVYHIGGCTTTCAAGAQVTTVYYAKIASDGSLGTWTSAANVLPAGRYGMTTVYINGYLYVIGGDSGAGAFGATPQTSVYYSKMNNDGSLGIWQTSNNSLLAAREFQTSMYANGFIYAIGGDNAGAQSTVYYAKAYADGSTSSWSTTTALTTGASARRYASTVTANGFVYVIGGDTGGTAQNTVYYNSINSDGTLGATWSSTTAIAVGGTQNRRHETATVLNGYVYVIGGDNGTTAQSTVYYAKLLPDGTIGTWLATSNPLPAARYGATTTMVNGYIYAIGGFDGTNDIATPYYASTERTLIGGSLDLVGLSGQSLSDAGGAGSITAGNIRAIGGLTVDGYADFNNGLSVDSALNINAISSSAGQTVLNINNLNSNSIFSIRHMSTNFGSLATAGAFVQKNSYWGQEYSVGHTTACNTTAALSAGTVNAYARGDNGGNANTTTACASGATTTVNGGGMNVGDTIGTATIANNQCLISSQNVANGVERISAVIATAVAGSKAACDETLAANTTTSYKILTTTNLPVMTFKLKASAFSANATGSVFEFGMASGDQPTNMGGAASANNLPASGVFFTNCSTYGVSGAPSGCSNTSWYGMVSSGGAIVGSAVTCTTGSGNITTNFSYLRIEVRASNDIHFYADYNTADGINETECGIGVSGASSASTMTPFVEVKAIANAVLTNTLDVDYIRSWQDDNIAPAADASPTAPDSQAALSTPPLTTNFVNTTDSSNSSSGTAVAATQTSGSFFDFAAATSDDTVFNNNVYVHGTIYADKIVANQVEGMDVITDQIKSLSDELAKQQTAAPATTKTGLSGAGNGNGKLSFTTVSAVNLTVLAQIETKGGLVVDGDAQFNGKTLFQLAAEFNGPANFNGQVTYNSDAGGLAIIKNGDQKVTVKFSKEYTTKPIIIANWLLNDTKDAQGNVDTSDAKQQRLLDGGYSYSVSNVTTKGFDIVLNKKAGEDVELSWIANAIKNAQVSQSSQGSSL